MKVDIPIEAVFTSAVVVSDSAVGESIIVTQVLDVELDKLE